MLEILSKIGIRNEPDDYGEPAIKGAVPVKFSADNFHPLSEERGFKIGFVDGGNNSIYLSPGHAVHLVRLYYSIFKDTKKIEFGRYTFIVDVNLNVENDNYVVKIYDVDSSSLLPQEIVLGSDEIDERDKIKAIGAYIRRVGEWILLRRISEKCDILVRDGSLQTGATREYEYANRVFEDSNKTIVGFSKTCSLITTKGYSLMASIHHLSKKIGIEAPWYYHPITKRITTIKGDMFAVKLHPFSDYVFRVEVYPEEYAPSALGSLVPMANDPTFLGYPYGLIDADINARIDDEEAKMYSQVLYNHANEFTRMQANALNAHDIISEVK